MLLKVSKNIESSPDLNAFFELSTVGILVTDSDNQVTAINPFPLEISLNNYTKNGTKYVVNCITNSPVWKSSASEFTKLNNGLENRKAHYSTDLREEIRQLEKSKDRLKNALSFQKRCLTLRALCYSY